MKLILFNKGKGTSRFSFSSKKSERKTKGMRENKFGEGPSQSQLRAEDVNRSRRRRKRVGKKYKTPKWE